MKRIALIFLSVISLTACKDEEVKPPIIPPTDAKEISLKIHIPKNSLSTYAGEDATALENRIDSLFINLSQGGIEIHQGKFGGADLKVLAGSNDSILNVAYEVDNITTGTLTVKVFANKRKPTKISGEVPIPTGPYNTLFYMSGETTLQLQPTGSYAGTVNVVRNVAKLRVNISKNSVVLPSDLGINYSGVKIEVVQTPDSTLGFGNMLPLLSPSFTANASRTGASLRPFTGNIGTFNGGQIDSLYLYENLLSDSYSGTGTNGTKIKITIPTLSQTEGNKTAEETYTMYTNLSKFAILRNYIYTLDIKVRGQSLEPLITLDIQPWEDVKVDGSVYGTYLTMDASEIVFDSNGKATINFCTDAQAVYFDYSGFNKDPENMANNIEINYNGIFPVGIEDADSYLAPADFKDGQILLDKQHCGSFGFELDLDEFPGFPAVNFSGKICIKAGNIVKCLSFPARKTYDAHFIVGEPILSGETFIDATVIEEKGTPGWLKVSKNRLFSVTDTMSRYSGAAISLYLQLDENLSGTTRTGNIVLVTASGAEKKVYITQLPAIPVGRFGYIGTATTDESIYSAELYTEQLYEFNTMPRYKTSAESVATPGNALYNGRTTATNTSVFDWPNYQTFNYSNLLYQAINYCAQKNRITGTSNLATELKWYLPAQAQLMGMWISNESYKEVGTSNFYKINSSNVKVYADTHWSSTDNTGYATQAQYVDFRYGNVGHHEKANQYWARCVRNGSNIKSMIDPYNVGYPLINFEVGMPTTSYTINSKGDGTGDENSSNNKTLYKQLRVASIDHSSGTAWSATACSGYSEGGMTGWRLPTQRELQAIWVLQNEIKYGFNGFKLLGDNYYWSATSSERTPANRWVVYGNGSPTNIGGAGNAPNHISTDSNIAVRCVKEIP